MITFDSSGQKKIYIWVAIVLTLGIIAGLFLLLRYPLNTPSQIAPAGNSTPSPAGSIGGHTGDSQIKPEEKAYSAKNEQPRSFDQPFTRPAAPRVPAPQVVENPIRSIALSVMLTYVIEDGVAIPLSVDPLMPTKEAANAYLEGAEGTVWLDFSSPVRFDKMDDRHIVVVYTFVMPRSSSLYGRSLEELQNFDFISIPVIVTGYESFLKKLLSFRCYLEVNGIRYNTSSSYSYKSSEQGGSMLRIPFSETLKRQFEEKK